MKHLRILALAALAAPAAFAQTYYYPRSDMPLDRTELRRCMDRDETLTQRQRDLENEQRMNEREAASIARANAALADELARLDTNDTTAVAAHNARAIEHNRRVEAHNLRVNDANAVARRERVTPVAVAIADRPVAAVDHDVTVIPLRDRNRLSDRSRLR